MDQILHSGSRWEPMSPGSQRPSEPAVTVERTSPRVVVIAAILVVAGLLGAVAGTTLARESHDAVVEQQGGEFR